MNTCDHSSCVCAHVCTRARLHTHRSSSMHFRWIKASAWDWVLCHTEKEVSKILLSYCKFSENSSPQWAVFLLRDASMVLQLVTAKARIYYFTLNLSFWRNYQGLSAGLSKVFAAVGADSWSSEQWHLKTQLWKNEWEQTGSSWVKRKNISLFKCYSRLFPSVTHHPVQA